MFNLFFFNYINFFSLILDVHCYYFQPKLMKWENTGFGRLRTLSHFFLIIRLMNMFLSFVSDIRFVLYVCIYMLVISCYYYRCIHMFTRINECLKNVCWHLCLCLLVCVCVCVHMKRQDSNGLALVWVVVSCRHSFIKCGI